MTHFPISEAQVNAFINRLTAQPTLRYYADVAPNGMYDAILEMPPRTLNNHAKTVVAQQGIYDDQSRDFLEKLYLRDLEAGVPIRDTFMRAVMQQHRAPLWMRHEALSWFLLKEEPIANHVMVSIEVYLTTSDVDKVPLYDAATQKRILAAHPELNECWNRSYPHGRVTPWEDILGKSVLLREWALWSCSIKSFPENWRALEQDSNFTSFVSQSAQQSQLLVQKEECGELALLFCHAYIRTHPHMFDGDAYIHDSILEEARRLAERRYNLSLEGVSLSYAPDILLSVDEIDPLTLMKSKPVACAGKWQKYAVQH